MPKIYTIGETVYDIIFRDDQPLAAKAGGAMLNTAVSLGRLGMPVHMISEYGFDPSGDIIDAFLRDNGVDTTYIHRYNQGKTAIALAFLDEHNDARYTFYKIYPKKRLDIDMPEFKKGDILLFGAFYSLLPEVRPQVLELVRIAKNDGAFVVYDPNIRSPHKNEIESLRNDVYENISLADVVRGSDEDFMTTFDIGSGKKAYELVRHHGCNVLLYTKSHIGVEAYLPGGMTEYPVPALNTISTIGAGDSFNAGLIYEFFRLDDKTLRGVVGNIEQAVNTAISFGSHVCTHYDNYISIAFAEKYRL